MMLTALGVDLEGNREVLAFRASAEEIDTPLNKSRGFFLQPPGLTIYHR